MALCGLVALARVNVDAGSSQRVRELVQAVIFAERLRRVARGVQSDRLLLYQRQSEEKSVRESVEVYRQKDVSAGRKHGQRE